MPEAALAALGHPALVPLALAALVAGLVRGICGFGTALLFVPVAARFETGGSIITFMLVMDFFGPLPMIRRAVAQADLRQSLRLFLGAALAMPLGVMCLTLAEPALFRAIVSAVAFGVLVLLVAGWRLARRPGPRGEVAVGGASGFLGGFMGLAGPPVILFYLSGSDAAARVRANIFVYFFLGEFLGFANLAAFGLLRADALVLGLLLALPYSAAMLAGAAIFRRRGDGFFRNVAYLTIGAAALSGLPLFDTWV